MISMPEHPICYTKWEHKSAMLHEHRCMVYCDAFCMQAGNAVCVTLLHPTCRPALIKIKMDPNLAPEPMLPVPAALLAWPPKAQETGKGVITSSAFVITCTHSSVTAQSLHHVQKLFITAC